jgi:hypothetical protein
MNIRRVSTGILAAAAVLFLVGDRAPVSAQFAAPSGLQGISPQAQAQIAALLGEKASRTPAQRKINSQILFAQRMARRQMIASGVRTLAVDLPMSDGNRVVLDVRATVTPGLLNRIRARGIQIISESATHGVMRLEASLDQVDMLAALPEVQHVGPKQEAVTSRMSDGGEAAPARPVVRPFDRAAFRARIMGALARQGVGTNVGTRQSEGDFTHKADVARSAWGIDGTGVKIGVLSDGVRNLATAQATGDLGPVTVVGPAAPCNTNDSCDEGTAMLEIVHDIAPGAQLFFASAFSGLPQFADNIRTLRNTYNCDIIVDDVFYFVESPFQDGQATNVVSPNNSGAIAQAVKDVAASGALYFSSAGNAGNLDAGTSGTWEGDFADGGAVTFPVPGRVHSFGGGQNYNVLTGSGLGVINLYWSDPLGASTNDYDLFLLDSTGTSVLRASTGFQDGTAPQDPYEQVSTSGQFATGSRIVIVKFSGSARFLHLGTGRGRLSIATTGETHGHSSTSAANSFGVAATPARSPGPSPNPFNSANTVETFSSDGPRRIFFNADGSAITPGNVSSTGGTVLNKPDLTAADRVSVTGAGGFPTVFSGTSAAAPHAAAIAALIKSADLTLTATQVRTALLNSAIDIHALGVDRNSGVGIVMADTGVSSVLGPLMTIDQPAASATVTQPFVISGWAIDRSAPTGTGVDAVHIYATLSGQPGVFLAAATYGAARSDVGSAYGARFASSGYSYSISGLAPGSYTLSVFVRSTTTSTFRISRAVAVTIGSGSQPVMALDVPTDESTVGSSFTISGWAIDRAATSGAGVDVVHVYAYPISGFNGGITGNPIFLQQIVVGNARPDIAAVYGSQFASSGYSSTISGLTPGTYRLYVYGHSVVAGTFNNFSAPIDVTVGSTASDPVMYIDSPQNGANLTRGVAFTIAGWAVDRGASTGTGVGNAGTPPIHVWAFPVGAPQNGFLAAAGSSSNPRGDIGNAFGTQFTNSGYSLSATIGAAGSYDLYVFMFCDLVGGSAPCQARITRVTVQ